ncbi:MAG: virulence RhuM family protein [Muribaculaceae bacterium]|nr:virulence RhuM family protein [Muribaculaceae bacterium]MDE6866518.1 virulence RhuM family protein [Muribaculaceae bacterium]
MNENTPIPLAPSSQDNEIILYQPDSTVKLEVRLENETVWLNRHQIATLFDRDVKTIGKHIANALKEELDGVPTIANFATVQIEGNRTVTRNIDYYNLDVIISVGYRVKSKRGIQFRAWANKVLKEYLLRGYSINQRLMYMENRIDHRLSEHDNQIKELSNRMDFFVRTSLPPKEGIIYDGQIFDAYTIMCDLIRSAKNRIIIVDNYIDDSVFVQLDKRASGVAATIYTPSISRALRQDLERHNAQYAPIEVKTFRRAHDRFLIIDDTVYHVGGSFKDLGKKLTAFSKMEIMTADELIAYLES